MFQQLLESNVTRTPRVGSSALSTVAHAALVAAAVALTATSRQRLVDVFEPHLIYVPVAVPPEMPHVAPAPRASARTSPTSSASTDLPALQLDPQITVGIPPVDFTRAASSATDFGVRSTDRGPSNGIERGVDDALVLGAEQVDRAVLLVPGTPMPAFPEALRAAGLSGAVLMEFVVDTVGRVEPGTIRLLQSDHEQFSAAVRTVMSRLRFLPAEVRGRRVRQLVRLPFRFDVHS